MGMDWGAISAVAEVVAAVAVVVSLIYLAVQIRGNSDLLERTIQATRTQNAGSVIENFDGWRRLILETNSADLWFRGVNDWKSLDRDERIQFNFIASTLIWDIWFLYQLQRNEGLIADVNTRLYQDLFKHPGFRDWLMDHRNYHSDDFGDFLDKVCESVGAARYQPGESSSLFAGGH
jgi:hypothetical protein